MTITVSHATQATGTDAGNGEIRKVQWNEDHVVIGAADLSAVNTFTASQIISTGASTGVFRLGANAGFARQIQLATGASARWILSANNVAEGGSNAGSDFNLDRYDDSGVFIARPLSISRATGLATFEGISVPTIELGSSVTDTTISRVRAGQIAVEGKPIPYIFAQSGTAVSVGAVTTETALATITFAGGELGPNGWLTVWTQWSNNNNANTKSMLIRVGGAAGTAFQNFNNTTSIGAVRPVCIVNNNSQSAQKTIVPVGNTFGVSTFTSAGPTATVNTAAAWDLVISGVKAVAGDTLTLEAYQVIVCYGA